MKGNENKPRGNKKNNKRKTCEAQEKKDAAEGGGSSSSPEYDHDACRRGDGTFETASAVGVESRNYQTARATINHASTLGSTFKHLMNGITIGEARDMREAVKEAAEAIRNDAFHPPPEGRENMPPPPPQIPEPDARGKGKGKGRGKGPARTADPEIRGKGKGPARTPEPDEEKKGKREWKKHAPSPEPDGKGKGKRGGRRKGKSKGKGPALPPETDGRRKRRRVREGEGLLANAKSEVGTGSVKGGSRSPGASSDTHGTRGGTRGVGTVRDSPCIFFFNVEMIHAVTQTKHCCRSVMASTKKTRKPTKETEHSNEGSIAIRFLRGVRIHVLRWVPIYLPAHALDIFIPCRTQNETPKGNQTRNPYTKYGISRLTLH